MLTTYNIFNKVFKIHKISKMQQNIESTSACPQKLYIGQHQSESRKILRQHLFSGRLLTLASLYQGKPLPVFESSERLFNYSINFHGKRFILKFSHKDPWTVHYIKKLNKFKDISQTYQSFGGALFGAVIGGLGVTGSMFTSIFSGLTKSLAAQLSSSICAVGILLKSTDTFCCIQAMTILLANLGAAFDVVSRIAWPLATGGMFWQSKFSWVPSAVGALLALVLGATTSAQFVGIFTKTASMGYTMSTVSSTTRLVKDCLENLVPFVYTTITGRPWELDSVSSTLASYTTFVTRVEDFEMNRACDIETNLNYQAEVMELQLLYRAVMEEADKLKMRLTVQPLIQAYYNKVNKWVTMVNASGLLRSGVRPEPLCILLSGQPGIGKSFMVNNLIKDVGAEHIPWKNTPTETISNHIYQRNPAIEHWSGYRQQFAVLYDDFMQLVDSPSRPNPEVNEMINVVGTNAFHLPMAELEEKARGFFRSELVVATSNINDFGASVVKSVVSPPALMRRFGVHALVTKEAGQFRFWLYQDGSLAADPISYEEFVNICRAQYLVKRKEFSARLVTSQVKTSGTPHQCVAKFIGYVSAPAHIQESAMKRSQAKAGTDHSYCHPSLPCHQVPQSLFSYFRSGPSLSEERVFKLWTVIMCGLDSIPFTLDPANKAKVDLAIADLTEELELYGSEDTYEHFASGQWKKEGFRNNPEIMEADATIFMSYLNIPFTVTVPSGGAESIVEWHSLAKAFLADTVFVMVEEDIDSLASLLWKKFIRVFQFGSSTLQRFGQTLADTTFAGALKVAILTGATGIFAWLYWNLLSPYLEKDDSYFEAEVLIFNESKNAMGAQKSQKGTTMRTESREALGKQAATKGKTMRMESTLDCYLEVVKTGKQEMVAIRADLWDTYKADPSSYNLRVLMKAMELYWQLCLASHNDDASITVKARVKRYFEHLVSSGQTSVEDLCLVSEADPEILAVAKTFPDLLAPIIDKMVDKLERKAQSFQGSGDQNSDGIAKKLLRNLCDVTVKNSSVQLSKIFFYQGRKAWINSHALAMLADYDWCVTRYFSGGGSSKMVFKFEDLKIIKHPQLDISLVQFPKTLSPFADVLNLIAMDGDLNFQYLPAGRIVTRREGEPMVINGPHPELHDRAIELPDGTITPVRATIGYDHMHTIAGDCGSPFLAVDPTRNRKVFGFHMMGNSTGSGTSIVVTQEVLHDLESKSDFEPEVVISDQRFQMEVDPHPYIDEPLAIIPTPFEPTVTKHRRSAIHGMVSAPITRPSILRSSENLDPMERGVRGFQKRRPIINERFQNEALSVLTRYCAGKPIIARTLTLDEAISGKDIPGLEPVDRSTSAGLPLCLAKGASGKKLWIAEDYTPSEDLVRMVADLEEQFRTGNIKDVPIFKDSLKDERVSMEKADINRPEKVKTRMFSASPLVFMLLLRKYYGAFFGHLIVNQVRNSCTSGVNPMSGDWQRMADWLHEVSNKVDDGDYSSFDSTQPSGFLLPVYKSIRNWYLLNGGSGEEDVIRERLAEFCIHAFHSTRGVVYRSEGSLPSGMIGTTAINSGVNLVAFFYAWRRIYPLSSPGEFLQHVRTLTHGDDVVFSVSDSFPEFTSANIGRALAEIGMIFTPAAKDGVETHARPIEEVNFLKRGFKKIHGIYRAPLATASSLEMCNWVTKSPDLISATVDNVITAMRELSISEPDTSLQQQLQAAVLTETGRLVPLISADEMCRSFYPSF